MRRGYLVLLLWALLPLSVWAQSCGLADTLIVLPNSTLSFDLEISDYFNDDLGDPMQGLCGVEVHFVHQLVDNFELSLTSPGGQTVDLIGPNGDNQFEFTFASQWRVTFLPSTETAVPDPFFPATWDNTMMEFGSGFIYTGSYYPYGGQLEDFNTGPVNGIWTVTMGNDPSFNPGAITYIRLIFCDSRGVECCFATPGEFANEDVLACIGDTTLAIDPLVSFPAGMADTTDYGYLFLIGEEGVFTRLDSVLDFTTAAPGNYQVCGFSYLHEELDSLPAPNGLLTIDSIRNNLNGLEPWLCAYLMEDCLGITIAAPPDTTFLSQTICAGDSLLFGAEQLMADGTYTITLPGYAGCDSVVQLNLMTQALPFVQVDSTICLGDSAVIGTQAYFTSGIYRDTLQTQLLGCDSIVELDLSVLDPVFSMIDPVICAGTSFQVGDSLLTTAGNYDILVPSSAGCDSIVQVNLTVLEPTAVIVPPLPIDCNNNGITLDGTNSIPAGMLSYVWRDPADNVLGNSAMLDVDTAGWYILQVSQELNGVICMAEDSVQVVDNRIAPIADAGLAGTLTCAQTSLMLGGPSTSTGIEFSYNWSTPDGTIISPTSVLNAEINAPGTYQLIVLNNGNGCRDTSTVGVEQDILPPVADAGPPDTLSCFEPQLQLGGPLTTQGDTVSYEWLVDGVGVPGAVGDTLWVDQAVLYSLIVTNDINACRDTAMVSVAVDTLRPLVMIAPPNDLNCATPSVTLAADYSPADLSVVPNWTTNGGQLGGDVNSLMPLAEAAGIYTLSLQNAANGCVGEASVTVDDIAVPIVAAPAEPDTLTCAEPIVELSAGASSLGPDIIYDWERLVNGQFVGDSTGMLVEVSQAGVYQLIVWDTLTFCADTAQLTVATNQLNPPVSAGDGFTLNCLVTSDTLSGSALPSNPDYVYSWAGPCSTPLSDTRETLVNCPGWYYFTVVDAANGCSTTDSVEVLENLLFPGADIALPDTLNCVTASVLLDGTSSEPNGLLAFQWSGPAIDGLTTNPTATATAEGLYSLIVSRTDNFCADTATVTVAGDFIPPVAAAGPDTLLNCYEPEIILYDPSVSTGSPYTYLWANTGGLIIGAEGDSLVVTNSDMYTLFVTDNTNGCQDTATVMVAANFDPPAMIDAGDNMDLDCENPVVQLQGDSSFYTMPVQPSWTGPCIVGAADTWTIEADCPGVYVLSVQDLTTGCSRLDSVEVVQLSDIAIAVLSPDTLTLSCDTGTATLETTGTSVGVYSWFRDGESISLPFPDPVIDEPGLYTLVVDNVGIICPDTAQALVIIDCNVTAAVAPADILTCMQQSVLLDGSSSTGEGPLAYEWLLPNPGCAVNSPDTDQLEVVCTGEYGLVVAQTILGVSDTFWVNVPIDTLPPLADAGPDQTITCSAPTVVLDGSNSSMGDDYIYSWINSTLDTVGSDLTYSTITGGTLFLQVRDTTNGCEDTDVVQVVLDSIVPVIAFGSEIFPCQQDSFGLQAFVDPPSPDYTYQWTGPAIIDQADSLTVWINNTGEYAFSVFNAQTGCSASDTITVIEQTCVPCVEAGPTDTLSCVQTNIELEAFFCLPCLGCTVQWFDEDGPIPGATLLILDVNEPGTYTFEATDTLGFTNTLSWEVIEMTTPPIVDIGPDATLSCDSLVVTLGTADTSTGSAFNNDWTRINGVPLLGNSPYFTTAIADTFVLTVTDMMTGCFAADTVIVSWDTISPVANAGMDQVLTCDDQIVVLDGNGSTLNEATYQWEGPEAGCLVGATTLSPLASCVGTYALTVTGDNGCTATDTVMVTSIDELPEITPFPDTVLTCANPTVILVGSPPNLEDYEYRWCELDDLGEELTFTCEFSLEYAVSEPGIYRFLVEDIETGCENSFVVNVSWDTIPPMVDAGPGATFFCTQDSIQLTGSSSASTEVIWSSNPAGLAIGDSLSLTPWIYTPAWYSLTATDTLNGCVSIDSVFIAQDEAAPSVDAGSADTLTCAVTSVQLQGSGMTTSGQAEWLWISPEGIITPPATNPAVEVTASAWYYLQLRDPVSECSAVDSVWVAADQRTPTAELDTLDPLFITCAIDTLLLDASASVDSTGQGLSYSWEAFPPGQLFPDLSAPTVMSDRPGDYRLVVTDEGNGCRDTLDFSIGIDLQEPTVNLTTDGFLTCTQDSVVIQSTGSSAGDSFSYRWFNLSQGLQLGPGDSLSVGDPAWYSLVITDTNNGCSQLDSIQVSADRQTPIASITLPDVIDCSQPSVVLDGSASDQGFYSYAWEAQDGGLLLGPANTLIDTAGAPGTYLLQVTDLSNGCDSIASVEVVAEGLPITGVQLTVNPPPCFGDVYGSVQVEEVEGGTPGFQYRLDGGPFGAIAFFENIALGEHTLEVVDANGCQWEEIFTIIPPIELTVDLGPDVEIKLGDSLTIEALVNVPYDTLIWRPAELISTPGSAIQLISPVESRFIVVTAVDGNGCMASDTMMVAVNEERQYFIPTAFSPDGNGQNDRFTLYGGNDVEQIDVLRIFDRWGNMVFERANFQPNDPNLGWDGTFQGRQVNSAVFVYYTEIRFIDGNAEVITGDLLLMR